MLKRFVTSVALVVSIAAGSSAPALADYDYIANNPFISYVPDPGSCFGSPCTFTDATWLNTIAQNYNSIEQGYMQAQNLLNGPTRGGLSSSGVQDPGLTSLLSKMEASGAGSDPTQQYMALASTMVENGASNESDLDNLLNVMQQSQGDLSAAQIAEVAQQKMAGAAEAQNQMAAYAAQQTQANTQKSYTNVSQSFDLNGAPDMGWSI